MQPITERPKSLQQPMSNCYIGYMVNNNNNTNVIKIRINWTFSLNLDQKIPIRKMAAIGGHRKLDTD